MHFTAYTAVAILASIPLITAAPIPYPNGGNGGDAFSGAGGNAAGGNSISKAGDNSKAFNGILGIELLNDLLEDGTLDDLDILGPVTVAELFSNNAGDGGEANSGDAFGGNGGNDSGCCAECGDGQRYGGNGGNAYSGAAGNASGGNVVDNGSEGLTVVKAFSGNAGDGGAANSGNAFGGNGGTVKC